MTNPMPPQPGMPTTVLIHGYGCAPSVWDRLDARLRTMDLRFIRDWTAAWHLARGGAPVLFCDFSSRTPEGLEVGPITIAKVKAKYGRHEEDGESFDCLNLKLKPPEPDAPTKHQRPLHGPLGSRVLDVEALAELVQDAARNFGQQSTCQTRPRSRPQREARAASLFL